MFPPIPAVRIGLLMESVVDRDLIGSCCGDKLLEMLDGIHISETCGNFMVELPIRMEELVVRVDQDDGCAVRHY